VLLLVLFIVVAVGITNTMLMAVLERKREFGVMMALGTSRGQVTRLVFYEACLLGSAGLIVGWAVGVGAVTYLAQRGMDLGAYAQAMETMQGLTSVVYPAVRSDRVLLLSALVLATAIIAALYPAAGAVRLSPVEAIRGLREAVPGRRKSRAIEARAWPLFWKIAARGIVRNPRRTLLTLTATSFGLAAFVFLLSFVEGYLVQITDNSTGYLTGDLQIQHPDLRKDYDSSLILSAPELVLARVRSDPLVAAATPRVQVQALASSAQQTRNFMLLGIDPKTERKVTFIDRAVTHGTALESGQDLEIVVGYSLAEKLGVGLGEKIVVMAQAADGALGSAAYRISGIFTTESEAFDGAIGFVTLRSAQDLLGLGENVSTIAIALTERELLDQAAASLGARLPDGGYAVVSWQDLLPEVAQMIDYVEAMVRIVVAIVFVVVAMGVMNTLIMSVMERTREFGIMMALGTSPGAIVKLVLYESLVLTMIGIVLGLAVGAAIVTWIASSGIDLSRYTASAQSIPGLTGIIYPRLAGSDIWVPVWALLLASMLAALYPAWNAARLDPVSAIRHG
jgi:putative ABC transport system permease protein